MRVVIACLLAITPCLAADDVFSWFPLQEGHQWVYECTVKSGESPAKAYVDRSSAIVTVNEQVQTSKGIVVLFSVQEQRDGHVAQSTPCGIHKFPLLVRDSCVYKLTADLWDRVMRAFKPNFEAHLREESPDFCFPLQTGSTWKGTGDWAWTVEGTGPVKGGPQDVASDTIRLMTQQGGSTMYVWFQKGVGPVASWSWHHGSYTERIEELRR